MVRSLSAIPYVDARNWSRQVPAQEKTLLLVHCMEFPNKPDSAEWCGGFFANQPPHADHKPGEKCRCSSAHGCVDSNSIVQCVPWDRVAWHAPGANMFGIGVEFAGFGRETVADWSSTYCSSMLDLGAWLFAELATKNGIPIDFLTADELLDATKRGEKPRGITTHAECSKAWKKSTHTDPGSGFPIATFLRSIANYTLSTTGSV